MHALLWCAKCKLELPSIKTQHLGEVCSLRCLTFSVHLCHFPCVLFGSKVKIIIFASRKSVAAVSSPHACHYLPDEMCWGVSAVCRGAGTYYWRCMCGLIVEVCVITQEERWMTLCNEVIAFIETNHWNYSKHWLEEHDMLN